MHLLRHLLFTILLCTAVSCQQKNKVSTAATPQIIENQSSDTISLNLIDLQKQGKLDNSTEIIVIDDPVYHSTKRYNALHLIDLLEKYTSLKKIDVKNYQIIFECEDGYKPMMELQKFIMVKSYLAISDIDAPKGKLWSPIVKDGQQMQAAPFYLIYPVVSSKYTDYKWPYNLIKIHLVKNDHNVALLYPKYDSSAMAGFQLFKSNCISCHAINKIGGTMGPELNYPQNVTEYWQLDKLKEFIENPATFRNGVRMLKIAKLSTKDIDQIVYFLKYMAQHKLES